MSSRLCTLSLSLLLGLSAFTAWAGEGQLVIAETLLAAPERQAEVLAKLPAKGRVEVVEARGGWVRVKAYGLEGWIRRITLRLALAEAGPQYHGVETVREAKAVVAIAGFRKPEEGGPAVRLNREAALCDLPEPCAAPLLPARTPATLLESQGDWRLVATEQGQGWLPVSVLCRSGEIGAERYPSCP